MIISAKGDYALRIMAALCGKEGFSSLKDIAHDEGIPHKYSENIMTALAKAGLVEGARGKNGGYRLTRPPEKYPLSEILRCVENSFSVSGCTGECGKAELCPTLPIWRALDENVNEFLSRYTLCDLLRPV